MGDAEARRSAVDPARSVIVQAPAGSGKTTLLVERLLGLLGVVEAPEEILAITFTRKAAAEMRQRVLKFLDPKFKPEDHERQAWEKARAAEDKVRAWGLRENPQRLKIRTIDSFNQFLARTMPVAGRLGPAPSPMDNAETLFRQAARRVLARLDARGDALAGDLARLLQWRDHNIQDIEGLLAGLLAKRDQWLRVLGTGQPPDRAHQEALIDGLIRAHLDETRARLEAALRAAGSSGAELAGLLAFAHRSLVAGGRDSELEPFANPDGLPEAEPDAVPAWQGLAGALLTKNNANWRKSVTVDNGFPAKTAKKDRMTRLLQELSVDDALAEALDLARKLPEPGYAEEDWAVLQSLVEVMRSAAAELEVLFAESGRCDFAGLGQAALRGLGGSDEEVTDLGLYLDRRIRHILVDEYQDTNYPQYHLLQRLTAGWSPGDGRSLFLVGDPMQSIYRFREAEVGLFIRVRDFGLDGLALEDLRLETNFRSRAELVDWVNRKVGPIFPVEEDIAAGAVAFAPSAPGRATGGQIEVLAHRDRRAEAVSLAALLKAVQDERAGDPDFRAAVLVRGRNHLAELLPALKAADVAYRAVDLDPLIKRPVVGDLLALTRAVLNPADRSAVLALLRSPVAGLSLAELLALAGDGKNPLDPAGLDRLDAAARARARPVIEALEAAHAFWRRRPAAELVEGAWHRLGGPEVWGANPADRADQAAYLEFLAETEATEGLDDLTGFLEQIEGRYSASRPGRPGLEILTMHKAKGLEWDLVVIPGLDRPSGGGDRDLLHWLPFVTAAGDEEVLLAPLRSARHAENSRLVNFIRARRRAREDLESRRLLYVAATRAKERLVLSACPVSKSGEVKPPKGSLLADLWPTLADEFTAALGEKIEDGAAGDQPALPDQTLRRVAAGWSPPAGDALDWRPEMPPRERPVEIEFHWAGLQARRTGTVLHRLLERVGRVGIERLTDNHRRRLIAAIPKLLASLGTAAEALDETAGVIRDAFKRTLDSDTGRWMLSNRHRDAACELAVSGVIDGELVNAVIDRTFIDEHGTRWIIDYKSGYHEGGDLEGFLGEEAARYSAQLGTYRRLFEAMGECDIATALYLPRHGELKVV